ncbi:unnamed protein product [Cladocopium goreaui]|uniref:Copia protein n=1 Tax=Cladocopium goreaui TaxID=2562237 RepID=A0A9P1D0V7_9DINO|nr:unnamed protein product [Cladocopium goreaui]
MSDASWGIRREGHSQGGYLLMLAPKEILDGQATNYIILDWRSFRLPRCLSADYTLQSPGEWVISKTALVVDAKALYDSIRAEVPKLSGDKRTKIEVMIVKEKMQECQTLLRWVSSEAQYADGMTKPQARQLLTDRLLRTHMFKLQADEDFVAAKKKAQQQREANARKFAFSKAASKIGGLAHLAFISQIMPVTASPADEFREDKQRVIGSYKPELETLESYAQVMKDSSETNKQDAERFRADLKKIKLELEFSELAHIETKEKLEEAEI